jgi:hypothetical protein
MQAAVVAAWAMTMEEMNVFRIAERKIVRTIYCSVKQRHKGHITNGRYCKIYRIPQTRMVWSR